MKKIILILLGILCYFLLENFSYAENRIIDLQVWQATHGAKVYFVAAKEVPMVDIQIVFAAGSAYDGKQWGLASLVNKMLGEGTQTQNSNQIAEAFDNVGAQFTSNLDRDMAVLRLRSLSAEKYFNPALNEFIKVISQANFSEAILQRIKNQIQIAIKQSQEDPGTIATDAFYQAIYGAQPYGHPVLGSAQSVESINKEAVESFYKEYYVAQNADIIIVGDLNKQQAELVGNLIGKSLPEGKMAKLNLISPNIKSSVEQINFPTQQTTIIMGQLGINRENPDYFPLIVGNAILGGLPFSSNLFQQIRTQRGLTYSIDSSFDPLRYQGIFSINFKTKSTDPLQILELVRQIVRKFMDYGPTMKELKAAQENLIGSFPLKLASNGDILNTVTALAFYRRKLDYLDKYRENIAAVTITQIKQAFTKTLNLSRWVVIMVGPKAHSVQDSVVKPRSGG